MRRPRNRLGMSGSSTAASCFHLTFPTVSVLVGCSGQLVQMGLQVCFRLNSSGFWPGYQDQAFFMPGATDC